MFREPLVIAVLEGLVTHQGEQTIIISCNGVGFELFVPSPSNFTLNQTVTVYTYLHWNQENGFSLFGFTSTQERAIFLLIIECQGIGPKLALTILYQLNVHGFVHAISTQDISTLSSVSGIGKKKAELMILHLQEKLNKLIQKGIISMGEHQSHLPQITQVLTSLNYSRTEINAALEYIKKNSDQTLGFDQILRKALSFLAKHP